MHEKINCLRKDIAKLTNDCAGVWTPQMEIDSLTNHKTILRLVEKRGKGEPWQGNSKTTDPFIDVQEYFRPITKPQYHKDPPKNAPILQPPTLVEHGIDLLDKNLRDMTGMRYVDSHFMTHGADTLCRANTPCWTCTRAAARQHRKSQVQFRKIRKSLSTEASTESETT